MSSTRRLQHLWKWITTYQVTTWFCHALISTSVALCFWPWGLNAVRWALWAMAVLYLIREIMDLFKHARELDQAFDPEGITPRTDFFGDLVGPLTAAWTAQICYWVSQ